MTNESYFDREYFESGRKTTAQEMLKGRPGDPVADALARLLVQVFRLERYDQVLEFGCGKGAVVRELQSSSGVSALGFDVSQYAVSRADTPVENTIVCHDVTESWPYSPVSFYLVFSIEVLEHIPEDKVREVFREAYRVLRPRGYLACSIATQRDLARVEEILRVHPEQRDESHVTSKPWTWWASEGEFGGLRFDPDKTRELTTTLVPIKCSPYYNSLTRDEVWHPLDDSPFELQGRFAWSMLVWQKP
jgi:SAM-dependent methyltransferase